MQDPIPTGKQTVTLFSAQCDYKNLHYTFPWIFPVLPVVESHQGDACRAPSESTCPPNLYTYKLVIRHARTNNMIQM